MADRLSLPIGTWVRFTAWHPVLKRNPGRIERYARGFYEVRYLMPDGTTGLGGWDDSCCEVAAPTAEELEQWLLALLST